MAGTPSYSPSHMGLCVADLDKSLRFYCEGLGFEAAERYELDSDIAPGLDKALEVPGRTEVISQFVRSGGMAIELLWYRSHQPIGVPSQTRLQLGLTHLSFYVDDVDAAVEHLLAHGGSLVAGTRQQPGIDLVFVHDPDGTRVELMQGPPAA
jgi:catechol 2,3-dioxygenase-like lactoylglutathione lyase family enzyme